MSAQSNNSRLWTIDSISEHFRTLVWLVWPSERETIWAPGALINWWTWTRSIHPSLPTESWCNLSKLWEMNLSSPVSHSTVWKCTTWLTSELYWSRHIKSKWSWTTEINKHYFPVLVWFLGHVVILLLDRSSDDQQVYSFIWTRGWGTVRPGDLRLVTELQHWFLFFFSPSFLRWEVRGAAESNLLCVWVFVNTQLTLLRFFFFKPVG